ncbi:hypothetical protein AVEN_57616-1 [Araneus ventricosus]|uniref:Uncharacterized protein n=1 Tax=Araneus ventricosus TaxID=182803 RepID=A0A4Y2LUZ1_ARAVE|nr:hypothetical protein AVEN_57616-1 [Araneus ventricosus]
MRNRRISKRVLASLGATEKVGAELSSTGTGTRLLLERWAVASDGCWDCDLKKWAAQSFNKLDFEEELADGTLFGEGETRWILEESPEGTTKAVLSSLGGDGLKKRRS